MIDERRRWQWQAGQCKGVLSQWRKMLGLGLGPGGNVNHGGLPQPFTPSEPEILTLSTLNPKLKILNPAPQKKDQPEFGGGRGAGWGSNAKDPKLK